MTDARSALDEVWRALGSGQGIGPALDVCDEECPLLAAGLFRAAVRRRFADAYDVRAVTRFVGDVYRILPAEHRYLLAPRVAEGFIRSELGGETAMVSDVPPGLGQALAIMQMVTRSIFEEAGDRALLGAEIAEVMTGYRALAERGGGRLESLYCGRALGETELTESVDALTAELSAAFPLPAGS